MAEGKYFIIDQATLDILQSDHDKLKNAKGPRVTNTPSALTIGDTPYPPTAPTRMESGFWARITGVGSGGDTHAWSEVVPIGDGVFSTLAGGRTGTATNNAAHDVNGRLRVPTGTIVWLDNRYVSGSEREFLFDITQGNKGSGTQTAMLFDGTIAWDVENQGTSRGMTTLVATVDSAGNFTNRAATFDANGNLVRLSGGTNGTLSGGGTNAAGGIDILDCSGYVVASGATQLQFGGGLTITAASNVGLWTFAGDYFNTGTGGAATWTPSGAIGFASAGALTGTYLTFDSSAYVTQSAIQMPTDNSAWDISFDFNFANLPGLPDVAVLYLDGTGRGISVTYNGAFEFFSGTSGFLADTASAIYTTNDPHNFRVTWDGAVLLAYLDGVLIPWTGGNMVDGQDISSTGTGTSSFGAVPGNPSNPDGALANLSLSTGGGVPVITPGGFTSSDDSVKFVETDCGLDFSVPGATNTGGIDLIDCSGSTSATGVTSIQIFGAQSYGSTGRGVIDARPATNDRWITIATGTNCQTLLGHATAGATVSGLETTFLSSISGTRNTNTAGVQLIAGTLTISVDAKGHVNTASAGTTNTTNLPKIPQVIDDLADVVITSASNSQTLRFNGTNWINTDCTSGGGGSNVAGIIYKYFKYSGTPLASMDFTIDNARNWNLMDFVYSFRLAQTPTLFDSLGATGNAAGVSVGRPGDVFATVLASGAQGYYRGNITIQTTSNGGAILVRLNNQDLFNTGSCYASVRIQPLTPLVSTNAADYV